MSVLAHIGSAGAKQVITAIVDAGLSQSLVEAFRERQGVLSISHHHARGVGSERIRAGQLYFRERDVVIVLVEGNYFEALFAALYDAGRVGRPGGGLIFSETVLRGHPLLPADLADLADW